MMRQHVIPMNGEVRWICAFSYNEGTVFDPHDMALGFNEFQHHQNILVVVCCKPPGRTELLIIERAFV